MNYKNTYITFVFLGLILFQTVGFYAFFPVLKYQAKQSANQITQKRKHKKIEKLVIPLNQLQKIKWIHKKEFLYKNKMYDIVELQQTDTALVITCYEDKKERHLFIQLNKILESNFGKKTNADGKKAEIKKYPKFIIPANAIFNTETSLKNIAFIQINIQTKDSFCSIPVPPPEFVL